MTTKDFTPLYLAVRVAAGKNYPCGCAKGEGDPVTCKCNPTTASIRV